MVLEIVWTFAKPLLQQVEQYRPANFVRPIACLLQHLEQNYYYQIAAASNKDPISLMCQTGFM